MTKPPLQRSAALCTLVQYIEVWSVDSDGQSMQLTTHCRLRGSLVDSGCSERRVRSGEGLAGMAWYQRRAIILQESPSELLQRIGYQNGIELSALIAYPVMRGQQVLAVVVLGIGGGPGAFEVWSRDERDELSISSSYYSGLRRFEFISRHVRFPRGAGLPGFVRKTGQPQIASDLSSNAHFMRSFSADEAELSIGLGLPVGSAAGNSDCILLLLSSPARPIAVSFEIRHPQQEAVSRSAPFAGAEAIVQQSWNSGQPVLSTGMSAGVGSGSDVGDSGTIRAFLAIPVYRGQEKAAVVLMVF